MTKSSNSADRATSGQASTSSGELRRLEDELAAQGEELAAQEERLTAAIEARVDGLDARVVSFKRRVRELAEQMRSHETAVAEVRAGIDEIGRQASAGQLDRARIDSILFGLRERMVEDNDPQAGDRLMMGAIQQLSDQVAGLGQVVSTMRLSVDKQLRVAATVDNSLASVEARLAHVQTRLERHLSPVERGAAETRAEIDARYAEFFEIAQRVVSDGRTLLGYDRLWVLWQAARQVASLRLPLVEVGAYRGGSAFFLANALAANGADQAAVHVIDTFSGHPAASVSEFDSEHHSANVFSDADVADVTAYLEAVPSVVIHQGDVIDLLPEFSDGQFGLIHLDTDLYVPTIAGLEFFGQRLVPGGMMVVDDFGASKCPGIRRAVDEFVEASPEFIFWTFGTEQAVLTRAVVPAALEPAEA